MLWLGFTLIAVAVLGAGALVVKYELDVNLFR